MPRRQDNPYAPHDWAPHEKPALLGSPSTPLHSPAKRLAYGVVGLLVCLTGALGNAVVTANLQLLQGTFAAWSTEIAWLPALTETLHTEFRDDRFVAALDLDRLLVGVGGLVDAFGDQCVIHIGHGHQPRRQRDGVAHQALGVA